MFIVDGGAAGPCAVLAGDFDRTAGAVVDDDDLLAGPGTVGADEHPGPSKWAGTEYGAFSKVTIGVFSGTLRARPNATVWAVSGIRCNRGASSTSMAAGLRRVTRCSR
nr:hypothetical protein [[Micrococcus luteus] ATCC 49442]